MIKCVKMRVISLICAHHWSAMAVIMVKQEIGLPFVFYLHSTEWGRSFDGGSKMVTHIEEKRSHMEKAAEMGKRGRRRVIFHPG